MTNLKYKEIWKTLILSLGVIFVFSFFINTFDLIDKTFFYIFQHRDILRARELLKGHMIFFGPEMTGGGNLPGSLYYFFLALSQWIKSGWVSAWYLQYGLALIAVLAGFFFFRIKGTKTQSLLWVFLFSLAPFTANFLRLFLNVSSMMVFCVMTIIFILELYDDCVEVRKKHIYFYAAMLSIGLGLHFHFSIICYFLALSFLNFFSKSLSLYKIPLGVFFKGIIFLVIPALPYLIWLTLSRYSIHLGVPAFYAGQSIDSPSSLLHLMTYGYSEPFYIVLKNTLLGLLPIVLIVTLPFLFIDKHGESGSTLAKLNHKIKPLFALLFFSFFPVVEFCFSPQAYRYTMPFYLSVLFATVFIFDYLIQSSKRLNIFIISSFFLQILMWGCFYYFFKFRFKSTFCYTFLIVFVVAITFFITNRGAPKKGAALMIGLMLFASISYTQSAFSSLGAFSSKEWSFFMPKYEDWRNIWSAVHRYTGWNYEEARRRLYYVGHHLEQDPELALSDFNNQEIVKINPLQTPDGFFISNRFRYMFLRMRGLSMTAQSWLKHQNMQPEILAAIKNGTIKLGENLSTEILIIPFWVMDKKELPAFFHDLGEGYRLSEDDQKLSLVKGSEGVIKINDNSLLFKWNENTDQNPFTSTGAIVDILDKKNFGHEVRVKIIGSTLSQITPWVAPSWTQAWISPYLDLKCGKSKMFRLPIASTVGFSRNSSHDQRTPILQGNNSFVGPFERSFEVRCKDGLTEIGLGRQASSVEMITQVKMLPGKYLSISL